ncbi:MAG: RecX family transcriptional regulator [Candidatus Neomarinimicrobiota bacterium]|nr:RecX family transcriptional regulator [Candidatus Neomarinimicrobiota bacterium]
MKKLPKKKLKIVSISSQKRRIDRYTVQFDTGDVFGLSEDVFIYSQLRGGQEITWTELEAIKLQEGIARIRHSALHLLSYRIRSKAELSQRLLQKKFGVNQVASVIDELEKKGYLNDREFAAVFVRDRVKNKKLGPVAVRNEIVRHQISPEILEETMEDIYQEFPQEVLISSIIEKRSNTIKDKTVKERKRLIDHLQRKGYHWSAIQPIMAVSGWLEP